MHRNVMPWRLEPFGNNVHCTLKFLRLNPIGFMGFRRIVSKIGRIQLHFDALKLTGFFRSHFSNSRRFTTKHKNHKTTFLIDQKHIRLQPLDSDFREIYCTAIKYRCCARRQKKWTQYIQIVDPVLDNGRSGVARPERFNQG